MSYAQKHFDGFTIDWLSGVLVALLVGFQLSVLYIVHPAAGTTEAAQAQSTSAAQGTGLLTIAAIEIAILIVLWRLYKRAPEWLKTRIKQGLKTIFYPLILLSRLFGNYRWLAFNVAGFGFGAIAASVLSLQFAPIVVLLFLVAFTIYDHFAVNLSNIMGDLVQFSSNARLPNFIVIPRSMNVDLDGLRAFINGERESKPESVAMVIGVGDFLFPALLPASGYIQHGMTAAIVGAVSGTAIAGVWLRHSLETADGGLPALPWLVTGSVVGFGIGAVLSPVSIMTVLGL
jgi:hypothetical protein